MPNKKYFSYIRVSTQRQGQSGTSLTEQQAAIEQFAVGWNLRIVKRFEERETAAKQGRPIFLEMLKQLRQGHAHGVVIHKIDRGARNLKDWAALGSLIDSGIEVHFAAESLDINSRGGRLSADIQAVVAADYIRNLRDETKKGIYGRLKQGLFPFRAMTGYLDRGRGQPKVVDPLMGPLVRQAFEMYATGDWGLGAVCDKMKEMGLKSRDGKIISRNGLSNILHSSFYMGVIGLKKTRQTFVGVHEPLISKALFDQVQDVFAGKKFPKVKHHFFEYRRLIRCQACGYVMTAERQKKKFVYYRCHSRECIRVCLSESSITHELVNVLKRLRFSEEEYQLIREISNEETSKMDDNLEAVRAEIENRLSQLKDRHSRLADAYVDGVFDEATYSQKKSEIIDEEVGLTQRQSEVEAETSQIASRLSDIFELANSAYLSYESAEPADRRALVKEITSNLSFDGKNVAIKLKKPFQIVADRRGGTEWLPTPGKHSNSFVTTKAVFQKCFDFELKAAKEDLGLKT
jgi:site-specific DNA recombinase